MTTYKRDLFDKANEIVKANNTKNSMRYNQNLSSGLFYCWHCKKNITFHNKKRERIKDKKVIGVYYTEMYKINHYPGCERNQYDQNFTPKEKLDFLVNVLFNDFIYDQESIEQYYLMQKAKNKELEDSQKLDIERLEKEKKSINSDKKKLFDLYLKVEDKDLSNRIEELSGKEKLIEAKIKEIENQLYLSREELEDVLFMMTLDLESEFEALREQPFQQRKFISKFRDDAYIKDNQIYWRWITGKEAIYTFEVVDRMYDDYINSKEPEELSSIEINYVPQKRKNWKDNQEYDH